MNFLTAPLGSLSLLAIVYAFYIMANLSRRYGQVIRLPPYYRGYYAGIVLICLAFVGHLMRDSAILAPPGQGPRLLRNDTFYLIVYHLPLALAVTLAIGVSWRYWSWILKEQHE
jgi:hypothetical protein